MFHRLEWQNDNDLDGDFELWIYTVSQRVWRQGVKKPLGQLKSIKYAALTLLKNSSLHNCLFYSISGLLLSWREIT